MNPVNERANARERLRQSVDVLAERTNLHAQMQKDPLKMIGGASGVGLALGLLMGRRFRRTKKVYIERGLSVRDERDYVKSQKVQQKQQEAAAKGGLKGALIAAFTTVAVKTLQERVLAPQLERLADQIHEKATGSRRDAEPGARGRDAAPVRAARDPHRPM